MVAAAMSSPAIDITVIGYALARDALGGGSIAMKHPPGATVADAFDAIVATHPQLKPFQDTMAFAIEDQLVDRSRPLRCGDVLALLPPVSGG
jgi:molybdopterin converting factor small subunit